jgi:hypothetical protein
MHSSQQIQIQVVQLRMEMMMRKMMEERVKEMFFLKIQD